ncbi:MAG: hypothetical protein WA971_08325 [Microbacterium sp.]
MVKGDRANELLERAMDYLNREGLEGFSLASLAEGIGTSSRMLIYHLGSRDELLARVQALMRKEITAEWGRRRFTQLSVALLHNWEYYVVRIPHMQIFFHLVARSFEEPAKFVDVSSTAVSYWTDFYEDVALREGYPIKEAQIMARLTLAMYRGLILDLTITGDIERTSAAMERCAAMLEQRSPRHVAAEEAAPT